MPPLVDEDESTREASLSAPQAEVVGESPPPTEAPKEQPSPDTALVEALRQFIRAEATQPPPPPTAVPPRLRLLEGIILLVVVVDIVLLYGQFRAWFENPLFKFALQALPWMLGATAFAYSDSVRAWVLEECKHPVIGVCAVFIALPLLIIREPVFSVIATTPFDTVSIAKANQADNLKFRNIDGTHIRITVPDLLQAYSISITDDDQNHQPKEVAQSLGRWRVIKGTFAQLPGIKQIFPGFSLHVLPVYKVMTYPSANDSFIVAEGKLDKDFMGEVSKLSDFKCSDYPASSPQYSAIRCRVPPGKIGSFLLPPGTFNIARQGCTLPQKPQLTIPNSNNEILNMEDLCPQ